jgi:hypothetical protein
LSFFIVLSRHSLQVAQAGVHSQCVQLQVGRAGKQQKPAFASFPLLSGLLNTFGFPVRSR